MEGEPGPCLQILISYSFCFIAKLQFILLYITNIRRNTESCECVSANNHINCKLFSICFVFSFQFFLQLLCISLVSLIFRCSAQILLENAPFCRQNARLKNRLFCSKFWFIQAGKINKNTLVHFVIWKMFQVSSDNVSPLLELKKVGSSS